MSFCNVDSALPNVDTCYQVVDNVSMRSKLVGRPKNGFFGAGEVVRACTEFGFGDSESIGSGVAINHRPPSFRPGPLPGGGPSRVKRDSFPVLSPSGYP